MVSENQIVPDGYKLTEVGVIPSDWEVSRINEVIDYTKGFAFKARDYSTSGIRIIRVSDTTFDAIKNNGDGIYLPASNAAQHGKWQLKANDLIISTVGSKPPMYDSMVGKVTLVGREHEGCLLNQNAVIIRHKSYESSAQVLLHGCFKQKRYIEHIEKIFRGNANQASITLDELFQYQICFPKSNAEQRLIAEALADMDALLAALDKLIAKKRAVKTGAMQQLLTGQVRLPGFKGEWKALTFGDVIADCFSGATPSRRRSDYFKGNIRWITSAELEYGIITDTVEKITKEAMGAANLKLLPPGTFLMAITGLEAEGTRGACAIVGAESTSNQSCMAIFPTKNLDISYLFHYYVHYGNQFALQYCQGTKQQSYTAKLVKLLPIDLPPLKEQQAIAEILSDMDAEIAALAARRAKTAAVKQGMMQELLTGRVRLPHPNLPQGRDC